MEREEQRCDEKGCFALAGAPELRWPHAWGNGQMPPACSPSGDDTKQEIGTAGGSMTRAGEVLIARCPRNYFRPPQRVRALIVELSGEPRDRRAARGGAAEGLLPPSGVSGRRGLRGNACVPTTFRGTTSRARRGEQAHA